MIKEVADKATSKILIKKKGDFAMFIGELLSEIGYGIAFGITGMAAKADIALSSIGINTSRGGYCSGGGCTSARQSGQKPENPPEFSNEDGANAEAPNTNNTDSNTNPDAAPATDNKEPEATPADNTNPEAPKNNHTSHNFDVTGDVNADMRNRPIVNNDYNVFDNHSQPDPPQQKPVNPPQQKPIQQPTPMPNPAPSGPIMHAVDMPKKEKPVTMKQDPPIVDSDRNTSEILKAMRRLKAEVDTIPIGETPIAKAAAAATAEVIPNKLVSKFPQNQGLISMYPYLKDIEQIALDNGYQIRFVPFGDGVRINFIACQVVDNNTDKDIENKVFTIDLGRIIDSRSKIFIGLHQVYENVMPYHLFGIDKKLNTAFIRNLIVGGNDNIAGGKAMYTKDFVMANCFIDMSTIPNLNKEDRKFVQDLLVRAANSDTFDRIINEDKYTRFRVVEFDRESKSILIDSKGVPKHFGHGYINHPRHTFLLYYDSTEVDENGKPQPKAREIDENKLPPSLV